MYHHGAVYIHKFRILFAGVFATAFVLLISALVTSLGNDTVLASTTTPPPATNSAELDSPYFFSTAADNLVTNTKRDLLGTGRALYTTCRSITQTTNHTGVVIVHGTVAAAAGVNNGVLSINRGVARVTLDTLHLWGHSLAFAYQLPGKLISPVTSNVHMASAVLQPANTNPVPVIHTQLTAADMAIIDQELKQTEANQQKAAALQAAQAADNRRLDGVVVAGDPRHGGYPTQWDNAREDSLVDNWGMLNRECVSYTAWKVYQTYGYMPFWGGIGNANEWPADARAAGISTGSLPAVHSVAISMSGYYGHAMWVEKVQGNMIYVSQYNYDMQGHYSEMWVNDSDFTYIYFH